MSYYPDHVPCPNGCEFKYITLCYDNEGQGIWTFRCYKCPVCKEEMYEMFGSTKVEGEQKGRLWILH